MKIKIVLLTLLVFLALTLFLWRFLPKKTIPEKEVDLHLEKIKKTGRILIGTDATFPPFEFIDENGTIAGFDIDFGREIANFLGVTAEFKNIPWDDLFEALDRNEIDIVLAAVSITLERTEKMDFSIPYFNAGQVIVAKEEIAPFIQGISDLRGKKIGVQGGTTGEKEAKGLTEPSLVIAFEDYQKTKEALLNGEIEAILVDFPTAAEMVKKEKSLLIIGEPFTQEFYGVVVKKGEKGLLEEVNRAIRSIKEKGSLRELEQKWLR